MKPQHALHLRTPLLAVLVLFGGCAGTAPFEQAADWDKPVPRDVPRATVSLRLDLHPSQDCEERFDLALYQDRGIDLIEWDAERGRCADRHVRVRFLSQATSPEKVLALATKLAARVVVSEPAAEARHE
ncbi:MAG: hypothetical protein HY908_17100 [Myxococcales bacterium]|nr:hypothetical protein [Myxococcales bacterium]